MVDFNAPLDADVTQDFADGRMNDFVNGFATLDL